MRKKRGMLFVVLVLFLVVLLSFNGFPQDGETDSQPEKVLTGQVLYLWDKDRHCDDQHDVLTQLEVGSIEGDGDCGIVDHSQEIVPWGIEPLRGISSGCFMAMEDDDSSWSGDAGGADGASVALVSAGTLMDSNTYRSYREGIKGLTVWECSETDDDSGDGDSHVVEAGTGLISKDNVDDLQGAYCHAQPAKMRFPSSYICAPDNFWYPCNAANEDLTVWGEGPFNYLYVCAYEEERTPQYQWEQKDSDEDRDGYARMADGDCQDDPAKDPEGVECPVIDEAAYVGKTLEQIREDVKAECKYPQYSRCAVCINSEAPEVCGDGLNNDCGGEISDPEFDVDETEGKTSDNCHENQASCVQEPVFIGEQQAQPSGECSESKDSCTEDADCPDGESCDFPEEPTAYTAQGYNIYDEPFSWVETQDGGYCCGYSGVNDLGKNESNPEGNFLCLNKNLIGTEADVNGKDWIGDLLEGETEGEPRCGANWCWVNAISAETKFQIVTLRKPGKKPFDVVSNNDQWFVCQEGAPAILPEPAPVEGEHEDDLVKTHRFYCYDEGNRWSLAECTDAQSSRRNFGIKGRYAGEGLFSLPLVKDLTPNVEGDEVVIDPEREGKSLDFYSKWYKKFYGDYNYLDFSGYDYFNFMVKFVDEKPALPAGINLKIYGPEDENEDDIIYFDGEVLGYVQNGPLFEPDNYMHIQVPIGEYKAVKSFVLGVSQGAAANTMKVRNIYLSKDEGNARTTEGINPLCSGDNSVNVNSWLDDIDFGNPDQEINGKALCENLYGKNAWLGNDDVVDVASANCCGNQEHEYYAGSSTEVAATAELQEGQQSELNRYGCWNSQSVASGETIMNVEFDVTYPETKKEIEYQPIVIDPLQINWKRLTAAGYEKFLADEEIVGEDYSLGSGDCSKTPFTLEVGQNFAVLCEFSSLRDQFFGSEPRRTELWFKDLAEENDFIEVFFYDQITNLPVGEPTSPKKDKEGNLYITEDSWHLDAGKAESIWDHPLAVAVQLKKDKYFPSQPLVNFNFKQPSPVKVSYSCSQQECLLPLPGNPPYKITNLHPDLYELWFVTGSLATDETLITQADEEFSEYGNIKARKVAQQVVFYNEGDDAEINPGFYGCNAASFLAGNIDENKLSCSVIDGLFCSPSIMVRPADDPKEWYTTVNSWSSEEITKVGYEAVPEPEEEQNVNEYYQQLELTLKNKIVPPEKRNHTASVLPARNFMSNPEFTTSGKEIPHWEIFDANGNKVDNPKDPKYLSESGKISLGTNEKLRSERIAVPQNEDLQVSQAQDCKVDVFLVDKDGHSQQVSSLEFGTGDASYVIVQFTGACEVEKPMLQLVDNLGAAEYSFITQPVLENFDARSGAACCPDNYCWNGYACVEPMAGLTTLTEHITDDRDYRCIEGQWKKTDLQYDWNGQRWGFCPQENQCFVLSSSAGGSLNHKAEDFYQGNYPLCINNSEYIFDNYCDAGKWSSRTKFVATKLLEVAENDDFVIYCSPYKDTLLDFENKENYLGGDIPQVQQQAPTLAQTLGGSSQPETLATCYFDIKDPTGRRLIKDEQNTCINNVCVLKYKESGEFKVAFATTLNKAVDDEDSFLISLNIPQSALPGLCQESPTGDFAECDLSGLDVPGDLYYSNQLNAVIYAKEGISLSQGIVDSILNFFKKLFGGTAASPEKDFISDVQTFRDVYLLDKDGKKVRAVKEVLPEVRETLVAEYENFDTPVCDYVQNIKVPPELELELLEEVSGLFKVQCSVNESVQRVVLDAGSDFFWPQLTGKLRVNE